MRFLDQPSTLEMSNEDEDSDTASLEFDNFCISVVNSGPTFSLSPSAFLSIGLLFLAVDEMPVLYLLALAFHAHYGMKDFQLA